MFLANSSSLHPLVVCWNIALLTEREPSIAGFYKHGTPTGRLVSKLRVPFQICVIGAICGRSLLRFLAPRKWQSPCRFWLWAQ
jgi:hypothetical protein